MKTTLEEIIQSGLWLEFCETTGRELEAPEDPSEYVTVPEELWFAINDLGRRR